MAEKVKTKGLNGITFEIIQEIPKVTKTQVKGLNGILSETLSEMPKGLPDQEQTESIDSDSKQRLLWAVATLTSAGSLFVAISLMPTNPLMSLMTIIFGVTTTAYVGSLLFKSIKASLESE